jgi:HEPN domain-containing protein
MPGVKEWIAKASSDLNAARKLTKDDDTLDVAAYQTQQTAEKALKAYLIYKKQPIPRTHDLAKLLENCIKHDRSFERLREAVVILFPFAVYARYPDDRFHMDREEALEAIKYAEKILKFVKAKIEVAEKPPQMSIFQEE